LSILALGLFKKLIVTGGFYKPFNPTPISMLQEVLAL